MKNKYAKNYRSRRNSSRQALAKHPKAVSSLSFLLWLIPIGVSAFLVYKSPELINDLQGKDKKDKKKEKIQRIFKDIQKEEHNKSYSKSRTPHQPLETHEKVTLFYCELIDEGVKLVPVKVKITNNKAIIPQIIKLLLTPPSGYPDKYQTLIPRGTRLLAYHINGKQLTLDFNEDFLKEFYGEVGKKLKIAQIVSTLTSLGEVETILFQINGVQVKYLDSDGLILNRPFTGRDIQRVIASD
ncbi:MAG TPA: hypothetical protein ENI73_02830 [Spirochaetes bacterium]|nr:hypothetical protein [Spirochaetota bacterium]